ncbi:MAG TPA: class I SAM-dependent methyltransferase [Burkholderiales bacterium]
MRRRVVLGAIAAVGLAGWTRAAAPPRLAPDREGRRDPDVVYVPTPDDVVDKMLELAAVGAGDVVYDLGCGDGRIVIAAAQRYRARGVGIDIDPQRINEATANAVRAGVADRVRFIEGDLFEADIREATVVTLYLLTRLNAKLKPKLLQELKPGTRVVSHAFDMGNWAPERKEFVGASAVYLWRVPGRA